MDKKVLFVASVQIHIESFHLPYLQYFQEKGYEVHVATKGSGQIPYCDVFHEIDFTRNPLDKSNIRAYKQMKALFAQQHFALVHCHTPIASAIARMAAKKTLKAGTKLIYSVHGFHFYKGAPLSNWLMFYPIEKWLSRRCDALITSNDEDFAFAKRKMKAKHIYLAHGVGFDPERFPEKDDFENQHFRRSLGLHANDYAAIFAGELNENKNQGLLIKAVSKLNELYPYIHLFLAGDGNMKGAYENLARELGIEQRIHFLGYRRDINDLLRACDLYLSSSRREGLGLNVAEALYVGLPVVVTDIRGHRDLVKNGENGFLSSPEDPDIFADAMRLVLDDPALASKFADAATPSSRPFQLDQVKKEIIAIYESLLD